MKTDPLIFRDNKLLAKFLSAAADHFNIEFVTVDETLFEEEDSYQDLYAALEKRGIEVSNPEDFDIIIHLFRHTVLGDKDNYRWNLATPEQILERQELAAKLTRDVLEFRITKLTDFAFGGEK